MIPCPRVHTLDVPGTYPGMINITGLVPGSPRVYMIPCSRVYSLDAPGYIYIWA